VDKNYLVARREGDITSAYANTDKANTVLGWKAQSSLEEAMECVEMGTESEKSRIIIMKSVLFF
jgi:UDP-glucose 4-epimerase